MATVPDLSGNKPASLTAQGRDVDYELGSANRSNAGDPNGSLTPLFCGEIIYDSTNHAYYRAEIAGDNNSWVIGSIDA